MLKTAYSRALEEELLLDYPAMRVKNPPALRPKTRPVWSMEEIASTVVKARGLQVHAAGVLAGFSGLLWSDLHLKRGFVTVTRTVEEDEDGRSATTWCRWPGAGSRGPGEGRRRPALPTLDSRRI